MKFVRFKCDYADEFDVYGFRIWSDREWEVYVQCVNEHDFEQEVEFSFGTNEVRFNRAEDYLNCMIVENVTEEEAAGLIDRLFGLCPEWRSWGFFPEFVEVEEKMEKILGINGSCSVHQTPQPDCRRCQLHPRDLFPDWDKKVAEAKAAGSMHCPECDFEFYLTSSFCPMCYWERPSSASKKR